MKQQKFSQKLGDWLSNDEPKTLQKLLDAFGEKSFAVLVIVLMFLPALPLPTGGITHIFEVIVMLISLEMIIGRTTIWLPKFLLRRNLGDRTLKKAVPFMVKRIRWFEKFSRPRLGSLINHRYFLILNGFVFLGFALGAFLAPPFSGLDTLPALGAVVVALSLILEDVVVFGIGIGIGLLGIALEISLGAVIVEFIKRLF